MSDALKRRLRDVAEFDGLRVAEEAADRIEELEALIKNFFLLLDKTEETDDGRVFRPNRITSCRAEGAEKLNQVLLELKRAMGN